MIFQIFMLTRTTNILCLHIIIIVTGLITACTHTIDVIEINEVEYRQKVLTQIIESRVQVLEVNYSYHQLSLKLKDSVIIISTKDFPFITTDEQDCWVINGKRVSDKVIKQSSDKPRFPIVSISEDSFLVIDGCKSCVKLENTSLEAFQNYDNYFYAIAKSDSYICLFGKINITIPIISNPNLIIPDYFIDIVTKQEKLAEESVKDIASEDKFSYVFFTDAHWGRNQKHSPAIIKHIVDYTHIDRVIYGGDAITSQTETIHEALEIGTQFQNAYDFLGSRMLCLFGNHDDNSNGQVLLTDRHLSEEQVYSFLQSQMTDVNYWDYYNFYVDDPMSQTRLMCLDTGRLFTPDFRASTVETARFVIECLASVPDDWHVIAASHIWLSLKDFETGEAEEAPFVRPIIEIFENYNLRSKSFFSYGDKVIAYDFTKAGATVEYCIGGHIHVDAVVSSQKGLPIITVTCDGQQEVIGGLPYETGTINEQCVTIIVNDYQNNEVEVFHIGRGKDAKVDMWNLY